MGDFIYFLFKDLFFSDFGIPCQRFVLFNLSLIPQRLITSIAIYCLKVNGGGLDILIPWVFNKGHFD